MAAIVYDGFALFAVCFVAGGLVFALRHGTPVQPATWWYTVYLAFACYAYFAYSWRRGFTLGMRSWKLRLVDNDGGAVSYRQTALRFAMSIVSWLPAGLGFWWGLIEREGRTWHDSVSGTRLVRAEEHRIP